MIYQTERLILRPWQEADLPLYRALNNDPDVMEHFPSQLSSAESDNQAHAFQHSIEENGFGFFAVERKDTGKFIGFIGLNQPNFEADFMPCTEIGWRLSKENWGQGFATEGALKALELGFYTFGFDEIVAFTATSNKRSMRVMEKIGMTFSHEFEHPKVAKESPIRQHVLYQIQKPS